MTVLVEIPPENPGTPPLRHSGPVYGYMVEGEMLFELEGDPPRIIKPGETFWEPGGDVIHYQAGEPRNGMESLCCSHGLQARRADAHVRR